ncbi:hypothetical protein B0H15DRAFT_958557 [Mycena belliarum]|uniref:Uncharacterized protein n=1 Tax=Mycena belliarum TaxID=1033014 RepID=A0AAD6TQN7_9AGAR|nr:hypothetical protein B0H15DRAFT_958557 [Mycena belliae]
MSSFGVRTGLIADVARMRPQTSLAVSPPAISTFVMLGIRKFSSLDARAATAGMAWTRWGLDTTARERLSTAAASPRSGTDLVVDHARVWHQARVGPHVQHAWTIGSAVEAASRSGLRACATRATPAYSAGPAHRDAIPAPPPPLPPSSTDARAANAIPTASVTSTVFAHPICTGMGRSAVVYAGAASVTKETIAGSVPHSAQSASPAGASHPTYGFYGYGYGSVPVYPRVYPCPTLKAVGVKETMQVVTGAGQVSLEGGSIGARTSAGGGIEQGRHGDVEA